MKFKRIIALMMVLCMAFGCSMPVSAAGTNTIINQTFHLSEGVSITTEYRTNEDVLAGTPNSEINILNGNVRSTSLPTQFCDLSIQNYSARMATIASSKLYTNKYFSPDTNNEIDISFTVYTTHSGTGTLRIGVYNITTGLESYTDYTFTDAVSDVISFSGLNQSYKYAVYFQSINTGSGTAVMNGNALIFWPSTYFG